jgi:hypothetical protein
MVGVLLGLLVGLFEGLWVGLMVGGAILRNTTESFSAFNGPVAG